MNFGVQVKSIIVGMCIAELSISTCNEKWAVEFQRHGDTVYKLGKLQGVAVYLDSAQLQQAASVLALLDADAADASTASRHGRSGGHHSGRIAATRRSRALSTFRHIFEAQVALGQISVEFNVSSTIERGSSKAGAKRPANDHALFSGGSGDRYSKGDARSYVDAYCYVLKPVSVAVRCILPMGNPLDKAKMAVAVVVDGIELSLADRQYALLMRIFSEHSDAWEAREVGLKYRSVLSFSDEDPDSDVADASSKEDSTDTDSDADSDAESSAFKEIGLVSKVKTPMPRSVPAQGLKGSAVLPQLNVKHRREWKRVFHSLSLRRRATLRAIERHRYLAEIAVEYIQLYLRRLKATEQQGLASLSQAERRYV